jgi:hypothetical protein
MHPDAQRPAEIVAIADQDVERVELHLIVVPARMQAKSDRPSTPNRIA